MKVDFDEFKDHYEAELQQAVAFAGQDVAFYTEAKAGQLIALATRHFGRLEDVKALDVGSGIGLTDRYLASAFGSLHGVDIAPGVVERARLRNPTVDYRVYEGSVLPYPDASFDLVFTVCVMHCLPPERWEGFLREMARVTRSRGLVVVFEHNPLHPLTRYIVRRSVLAGAKSLFGPKQARRLLERSGLSPLEGRYLLFFPWRGKISGKIENALRALPFGAQYCVTATK